MEIQTKSITITDLLLILPLSKVDLDQDTKRDYILISTIADEAEVDLDLNLQAVLLQDIPAIITGVGQGLLHQDQGLSVQGLLDKPERDTVPPLDLGHTDHLPTHEVLDILSILVWLGKMYLLVQGSMDIIQLHLGQGNPTPVQPTKEEILNHSAVAQGNYLESSID